MRRREFIAGLAGAVAWPLAAHAEQRVNIPRIGFLGLAGEFSGVEALRVGLRASATSKAPTLSSSGDGRKRSTNYLNSRVNVWLNVNVIFAPSSTFVEAARQVTTTIPIVFAVHADPVGLGHVASLARPGGNITGLSMLLTELSAKELEMMKEAIPHMRRIEFCGI